MPFIGRQPVIGNFQKCDSISVVNGQAAYTLQVGGVNVSPQSENHMLVSLNGILQAPVTSFTVSSSTITFASNLVTGDVIDFIMILGNVLDLGVPSDNTVSLAKLTATGTKDATTFLRGDNTFAEAGGGKVLQVVNTTNTAQKTTTSTSFTGTSISLSITPSSASSKILILSSSNVFADTTGEGTIVTVYRGATNLGHSVEGMGRFQNGASNLYSNWSVSVFDSPATTSATTYEIYFRATGGGAIAYVSNGTSPTFLTALEIGA